MSESELRIVRNISVAPGSMQAVARVERLEKPPKMNAISAPVLGFFPANTLERRNGMTEHTVHTKAHRSFKDPGVCPHRARHLLGFLLLSLLCVSVLALGQDADSKGDSDAPRSSLEKLGTQKHFTGDWGGFRTKTEDGR